MPTTFEQQQKKRGAFTPSVNLQQRMMLHKDVQHTK